jgi:hypothetical protein
MPVLSVSRNYEDFHYATNSTPSSAARYTASSSSIDLEEFTFIAIHARRSVEHGTACFTPPTMRSQGHCAVWVVMQPQVMPQMTPEAASVSIEAFRSSAARIASSVI